MNLPNKLTVMRVILIPFVMFFYLASFIPGGKIVAIILFVGRLTMLMLGMIGEYIGRIYISINNSPQYVIREIVQNKDEK